jgi:hypothetical protein
MFDATSVKVRRYARPFYRKLSPDIQEKFLNLVKEYLKEKWWWVKDWSTLCKDTRVLPPANIFCVRGSGSRQKLRLVCDLRPANACLPEVSSQTDPIIRILVNALMSASPCLVVSDARAAFYKIKTDRNVVIELEGPTESYFSDRITFGISSGPGICNFALGRLRTAVLPELSQRVSAFNLFVDDSVMCGETLAVYQGFRKWIGLLDQTGNDITLRKLSVLAADLEEAQRIFGSEVPISSKAKLLGLMLYYDDGHLVLDCSRTEVRKAALEFVAQVSTTQVTTKRAVFEIAGRLGYDPLGGHAVERAIADALRSVFGALMIGWTEPIRLTTLSSVERNCIETIFDWILDEFPNAVPCNHRVKVADGSASDTVREIEFVGCSDASEAGGSYVLYMNGLKISEKAWFWKGKTLGALDVNLKELEAQVALLQECVRIMPSTELDRAFMRRRFSFKFFLYTDNRAVNAWMQSGRDIPSVLGTRRMMVARNLLSILRPISIVKVQYLEGSLNHEADRLSRLFERPTKFNSRISLCHLLADRCYAAALVENEEVSVIRDNTAEPESIADRLAAEDVTFSGLLENVKLLRLALRGWKFRRDDTISRESLEVPQFDNEMALVRIFQSSKLKPNLRIHFNFPASIPVASPIQFDKRTGVLVKRIPQADGGSNWVPLIPQYSCLAKSIARKVHEEAGHPDVLVSKLRTESYYYIPAVSKILSSVIHYCVVCQRVRALQSWQVEPAVCMSGLSLETMAASNPFTYVGIDFLSGGEGIKIFSVTCLMSRSVWWKVVDAEDAITAIVGLRLAQNQFGKIHTVVSDQGSYFRSPRFVIRLKKEIGDVRLIHIAPRAPWMGGLYEREHQEGIKLAKVLLATLNRKSRDLKFGTVSLQERVDRLVLIMNTRPLGVGIQSVVVTPDLLAWGRTREVFSFDRSRVAQDVQKVRRYFMDHAWKHLKTRSWVSIASRSNPPATGKDINQLKEGDRVLVFNRGGKIDPVAIGVFQRFHSPEDRKQIWVNLDGKFVLEHHYNIKPVEEDPAESGPMTVDNEPADTGERADVAEFRISTPDQNPESQSDAEFMEWSYEHNQDGDEADDSDFLTPSSVAGSSPGPEMRDFSTMTDPIIRPPRLPQQAPNARPLRPPPPPRSETITGTPFAPIGRERAGVVGEPGEDQPPTLVPISQSEDQADRSTIDQREATTEVESTITDVVRGKSKAKVAANDVKVAAKIYQSISAERPKRKAAAKAHEAWSSLKGRAC